MKVALILHRLTFKGGTQRQALELAQELKRLGHDVTLYAFECDPANTYTKLLEGLRIVTLPPEYDPKKVEPFLGLFTRPSFLAWWFKRNRWSRRLAHMIDPDTDILNPHAFYVYAVSHYFKKDIRNIPAVWMLNTMTLRSWKFWRTKQLSSSFHVSVFKRIFYRIMDWIEVHIFIRSHKIAVLSQVDQEYVSHWMGREAAVMPRGGDIRHFPYRERYAVQKREARVLLIGSFFEHRRFEDAIAALKILLDRGYRARIISVGAREDVEYFQKLQFLVRDLGLTEYVVFKGAVSEEELVRAYLENDIGIFTNIFHPGNLATFEMMACGAPTIVSRGAATHALLTHEENALLVPSKSPEAIADAVARLIDDKNLYCRLSKNGRKFVEENISWEKYAREMLNIFKSQFPMTNVQSNPKPQ